MATVCKKDVNYAIIDDELQRTKGLIASLGRSYSGDQSLVGSRTSEKCTIFQRNEKRALEIIRLIRNAGTSLEA